MKKIFKLTLFPGIATGLSAEMTEEAFKRWPHFKKYKPDGSEFNGVHFEAELGSTEFDEIIEFLRLCGKSPQWTASPPIRGGDKFLVGGINHFSREDMDNAQYLCFSTARWTINNLKREADGSYFVLKSDITKNQFGGSCPSLKQICLDAMKRRIETSDFIGPIFQPIKVVGKSPPVEDVWRIMSSHRMPAMKNRFINDDSELTEHQPGQPGYYLPDDLFQPWVFRYDAGEIAAMKPADVFWTKEDFGMDEAKLIVSQRFRRWCDQFKLHIEWVPVSIE